MYLDKLIKKRNLDSEFNCFVISLLLHFGFFVICVLMCCLNRKHSLLSDVSVPGFISGYAADGEMERRWVPRIKRGTTGQIQEVMRDSTVPKHLSYQLVKKTNTELGKSVNQSNTELAQLVRKSNTELAISVNKSNAELAKLIHKSNTELAKSVNKSNTELAKLIHQSNTILASKLSADSDKASNHASELLLKLHNAIAKYQAYPDGVISHHDTVKLKMNVSPEGDISHISVVNSSGNKLLDESALQAAQEASPVSEIKGLLAHDETFSVEILFQ